MISYPDLAVNGIKHTETLTPVSAFDMICSSLNEPPGACEGEDADAGSASKTGLIVGLSITGVILLIMGICCYKKVFRR